MPASNQYDAGLIPAACQRGGAYHGTKTYTTPRNLRAAAPTETSTAARSKPPCPLCRVRQRADLSPEQIIRRLAAVAPRTVRGRTRTPALIRNHVTMAVDGPVHERWKLGYLIDTIYLRDLWMHRIDAARATGRPPELSASHDGRIVADIAAEWARRHGRPFTLDLTGPAGGIYASRPGQPGTERICMDAVEFCRTLAGRAPATGLLTTIVPF